MTCAHCGEPVCDHPEPIYQGIVIIDDAHNGGSEPGSWARHLRHTACMRNNSSLKVNHDGGEIIARSGQ